MSDHLRGLTVRQPYAQLIATGGKRCENRKTNFRWRGLVAIHAGGRLHERYAHPDRRLHTYSTATLTAVPVAELPRSAILAVAELVDVHHSADERCGCDPLDAEHGRDVWHHVLDDVLPLADPIPWRAGALGYWHPPADLETKITALLSDWTAAGGEGATL